MSVFDRLFVLSQYVTPQHTVSRIAGSLAESKVARIKNTLIRTFIERYGVNMDEALRNSPEDYANFNDFFTRELKHGIRPNLAGDKGVACPVDGAISQLGKIEYGRIFQAKGHNFSLIDLLGGNLQDAQPFMGGEFATIYLSPKDYHRIHMPVDGTLRKMIYVPGKLFSVNPVTAANVPNLFARNERLVCLFDSAQGPVVMVLVGAIIVASIATVWGGTIAPHGDEVRTYEYGSKKAIKLKQAEEMGRFLLGSTVVLLFPEKTIKWDADLSADSNVRLGQEIGRIVS